MVLQMDSTMECTKRREKVFVSVFIFYFFYIFFFLLQAQTKPGQKKSELASWQVMIAGSTGGLKLFLSGE